MATGTGKTRTFLAAYRLRLHGDRPRSLLAISDEGHLYVQDGQHRLLPMIEALSKPQPPPAALPSLAAQPYQPRRLRVVSRAERYAKYMRQAEEWERTGRDQRRVERTTEHRVRNPATRTGVMIRCEGRCENPGCRDPEPIGYTDNGDPILEIDHVNEHAKGGRDHGSNAIALCPNCHALKTRGRDRHELADRLAEVAARRDQEILSRAHPGRTQA
ncbi:HNH endonuclease [Streptomyces sp. NPDC046862]|uniref:HNH endonuclease n=1 Tax=Streptomyces sp. NPDC046862 TaxID=3154603 RepID=UPI0034545D3D